MVKYSLVFLDSPSLFLYFIVNYYRKGIYFLMDGCTLLSLLKGMAQMDCMSAVPVLKVRKKSSTCWHFGSSWMRSNWKGTMWMLSSEARASPAHTEPTHPLFTLLLNPAIHTFNITHEHWHYTEGTITAEDTPRHSSLSIHGPAIYLASTSLRLRKLFNSCTNASH